MHSETAVIIGAGPCGLAAANQMELYRITPMVFESGSIGGLLRNAGAVMNYPGVAPGTTGAALAAMFPVPSRMMNKRVLSLSANPQGGYFLEWDHGQLRADVVIAASGTTPVTVPVPGVEKSRIYYEIADINRQDYTSAAVIGGGDAALDYAITLAGSMKVNVYSRSGFQGAVPHLLEKAKKTGSINLFPDWAVLENFTEDLVVVACGRKPNVGFIADDLLCSPPDDGSFHLCGDCINGLFRQASIAVGNGVKAAMEASAYLKKRKKA